MKLSTALKTCKRCPELLKERKSIILGDGPTPCPIVFLGESPGKLENEKGKSFCGMSGSVLTANTHRYGLTRGVDYHILNVVKCPTPKNRKPTNEEYLNCIPYLIKQLEVIQPTVILALGGIAQAFVLSQPVSQIHVTNNMGKVLRLNNYYAVLSCHPAFAVQNKQTLNAFRNHIRLVKEIARGKVPKKCAVLNAE